MGYRPADGSECPAERRRRDRRRVLARELRRSRDRRLYPDERAESCGEEELRKMRDRFVRDRFKSGTTHRYWKDKNPRRMVKEMTLAERRAREFAREQCMEAGVCCKLTRFRG